MTNLATIGLLNLAATFNSVDIEALYSNDDNANCTVLVEYRATGSSTWLPAQAFRYTETLTATSGTQRAFYSKVHNLLAGTSYDVRVTWADTDGVNGGANPQTGTIVTRAETIITPSALAAAATHFVSPSGSDSNAGTSVGVPWRTFTKARFAANATASDMVIKFAPGRYTAPDTASANFTGSTNHSYSLVAANPSAQEANVLIGGRPRLEVFASSLGSRSIIEPRSNIDGGPAIFAPTGTADADLQPGATSSEATSNSVVGTLTNTVPRIAPWTQVTVRGADAVDRTVWKAAGTISALLGNQQGSYLTSRDGTPIRVPAWYGKGSYSLGQANQPGVWAQVLANSPHLSSGFLIMEVAGVAFTEGGVGVTTNTTDVYLVMPPDAPNSNPNTLWWKFNGSSSGNNGSLMRLGGVAGNSLRVCGFDLSVGVRGVLVTQANNLTPVQNITIDHNLFRNHYQHVYMTCATGTPAGYINNAVIQYNLFQDDHMAAPIADQANVAKMDKIIIPWYWVKNTLQHDATLGNCPQRNISNEVVAVGWNGGGQFGVTRFNTVDGTFDFYSDQYSDGSFDRYTGYGSDIHDNIVRRTTDDMEDMSRHKINVSFYNNRGEYNASVYSQAPCWSGPTWIFGNEVWRQTNGLRGRAGVDPNLTWRVPAAPYWKYQGDNTTSSGLIVMFNNIGWTDQHGWPETNGAHGYSPDGGGAPNRPQKFWLRQNILRLTSGLIDFEYAGDTSLWDEDYNDWSSTDEGVLLSTNLFRSWVSQQDSFAVYQSETGKGAHSNPRGPASLLVDSELVNPANGDLRIRPGSALSAIGLVAPPQILPWIT